MQEWAVLEKIKIYRLSYLKNLTQNNSKVDFKLELIIVCRNGNCREKIIYFILHNICSKENTSNKISSCCMNHILL